MAEEEELRPASPAPQESSGWGWGGFISSLTDKASTLVESYVADIKEFGTTIGTDTSAALDVVAQKVGDATSADSTSNASAPLSTIKSGISNFMAGVSEMAHGVAQELGEIRGATVSPNPAHMSLTAAQMEEMLNSAEEGRFKEWMATFKLEERQTDISQLLANNSAVQSLYQQLVPNELTLEEFWGRYFFKLDQEAKKEEYRAALLSKTKAMASRLSESEFSWDDQDQETQPSQETDKKDETFSAASPLLETAPSASNDESDQINKSEAPQREPTPATTPQTEDKMETPAPLVGGLPEAPVADETAQGTSSTSHAPKQEESEDVFEWS